MVVHRLILGDCLEVMKNIPDNSVNMIITDPPWMISSGVVIHRSMSPIKYKAKKSIVLDFGEWDHFEDEKVYWQFTKNWLEECIRILKEKGHLITFFDQNKVSYLISLAKQKEMVMRQHLYWLKSNPVPRARKVDFMVALEHAVWFTKGTKSGATFNYQLGQQPNYIESAIPQHPRLHPTQKPLIVFEKWIAYLTNEGDVVLDPFLGSGTTSIACERLNRNSIGIELNEDYINISYKRLKQEVEQLKFDREKSTIEHINF